MWEEPKQKQAEELLERALSVFGECEPPSDLEDRILQQVRAARTTRRSAIRLPLVAAAAALLIAVVLIQNWNTPEAPKTTVAELPAPPSPKPATGNVGQVGPPERTTPAPSAKRPIARKALAVEPPVPTETSETSPLLQSDLAFSDITSSPIEIHEIEKETVPLVSELSSSADQRKSATERLINGL